MSRQMPFGVYGLDHPTWSEPQCFFYTSADAARAAILKVYGAGSEHIVIGPVDGAR